MNLPVNDASDEGAGNRGATDEDRTNEDGANEDGTEVRAADDGATGARAAGEGADRSGTPEPDEVDGPRPGKPERSTPTGAHNPATTASAGQAPLTRRRLDEIFGDVLPSTTRDERDDGGNPSSHDNDERWYRDNRPPHHG